MRLHADCTRIISAESAKHLGAVRDLFAEYARSLDIDLCFQGFAQELAGLPGLYAPPRGKLLLALEAGAPAGCVALRPLSDSICEMKRLFVRPAFRRKGLGRALALEAIQAGRSLGYAQMRLDTLTSLRKAIALYESLGFQRIEPYYESPSDRIVFMELRL